AARLGRTDLADAHSAVVEALLDGLVAQHEVERFRASDETVGRALAVLADLIREVAEVSVRIGAALCPRHGSRGEVRLLALGIECVQLAVVAQEFELGTLENLARHHLSGSPDLPIEPAESGERLLHCPGNEVTIQERIVASHSLERLPGMKRDLFIQKRGLELLAGKLGALVLVGDRKSTRLNSSHVKISYAVFCLI